MTDKTDKGERIHGRDLKISERDIFGSLPFFSRVRAWLFGGVYGIATESKTPRAVVVYIPPVWKRFYYKLFKPHKRIKDE